LRLKDEDEDKESSFKNKDKDLSKDKDLKIGPRGQQHNNKQYTFITTSRLD